MAVQYRRILSSLPEYDACSGPSAVFSFFDDILGGANSIEELLDLYDRTLQTLLASKVKLRFDKCSFGAPLLKFLGLIISSGGFALDRDRTSSLMNLSNFCPPQPLKKVSSTFSAALFSSETFAQPSSPSPPNRSIPWQRNLYLGKGKGRTKVDWGPEHDNALSQMKAMVDGSMLITLDPKRRLHVRTDASRLGIGCVLFQYSDNGTPQAICYAGKAFDSTQQDYSTVEQEPMLWCTLASALKILPKDTLSLW